MIAVITKNPRALASIVEDQRNINSNLRQLNNAVKTALMLAASLKQLDCVKLLAPFETEIRCQSTGQTALMLAAGVGFVEAFPYLKRELMCTDNSGRTALIEAIYNK